MDLVGNFLRLQSFVNFQGFLRGVEHHPTVGALGNVLFDAAADVTVGRLVEVFVQLV
jgi:hypothetical protein